MNTFIKNPACYKTFPGRMHYMTGLREEQKQFPEIYMAISLSLEISIFSPVI